MKPLTAATLAIILASALYLSCSEDDEKQAPTRPPTLEQRLANLPGATLTEIDAPAGFSRAFEISLPQPVNHDNPSGQQFSQRVLISHRSESAPTVFITWGYMVSLNRVFPLSEILDANQILINHRYYGDAAPDPIDWQHLNVAQAAADCHRVVELLSPIYTGPWVSHGISKGGGTALQHRRSYPDDVLATVAHVAPVCVDTADTRYDNFLLNEVGDAACRDRLQQFQRLALSRRDSLLIFYQDYASQQQLTFRLGVETAFEINILEYLFYYWQYGPRDCSAIPDSTASTQEIFDYLQMESEISWLQDQHMDALMPAWYQFYTELGYYRLIDDHLADLIESPYPLSYSLFCPQGVTLSYDPSSQLDLIQWLQTHGHNIVYVYGEYDPVTACSIALTGQANALKIVLPGESHTAGSYGYGPFEAEVYDSLGSWLGVTIDASTVRAPVDGLHLDHMRDELGSP